MEILAFETSSPRGSLALWRDGAIVAGEEFHSERSHNSVLFAPLARMLRLTGDLRCIVCGTGPGSYTGVRVGIAAAIGISLAKKAPLIGLPSVLGLEAPRYAVCGDARRGAWWWAEVDDGALTTPPAVATLEETAARARAWEGAIFTADAASPPFCEALPAAPGAAILAARAAALSDAEIARLAAMSVEPLYLTAPFITLSKKPVFA
jgi:tRNA threonylcarbamoyladenosine biosynthesis protein TsaB